MSVTTACGLSREVQSIRRRARIYHACRARVIVLFLVGAAEVAWVAAGVYIGLGTRLDPLDPWRVAFAYSPFFLLLFMAAASWMVTRPR